MTLLAVSLFWGRKLSEGNWLTQMYLESCHWNWWVLWFACCNDGCLRKLHFSYAVQWNNSFTHTFSNNNLLLMHEPRMITSAHVHTVCTRMWTGVPGKVCWFASLLTYQVTQLHNWCCFVFSAYDYVIPASGKVVALTDLQIALPSGCYGRIGKFFMLNIELFVVGHS